MRIPLLVLAVVLVSAAPAWGAWRRPVSGAVARPFAYSAEAPFRAGAHRGADLAARGRSAVRAACAGVVVTAGMSVVTLRCGEWRVTALPLASFAVRATARACAPAPRSAASAPCAGHTGLHLGVRRAGDRFAYVDPVPLLAGPPAPPVTAVPRSGPRPAPPAGRAAPPRARAPGPPARRARRAPRPPRAAPRRPVVRARSRAAPTAARPSPARFESPRASPRAGWRLGPPGRGSRCCARGGRWRGQVQGAWAAGRTGGDGP